MNQTSAAFCASDSVKNLRQEIDRLRRENERYRNAIRDAKAFLEPQTRKMNPSLSAVRDAYWTLKSVVEF